MKIFIFLCTFFLSVSMFAQNHYLGIKGGGHVSNVTSQIYSPTTFNVGKSIGIFYEYTNSKSPSYGIDLLYSQRGFKFESLQVTTVGSITENKYSSDYIFSYISMPFKIGYNVGDKTKVNGYIGVVPSYLLESHVIVPSLSVTEVILGEARLDITDYMPRFDIAGMTELGVQHCILKGLWIVGTGTYQISKTSTLNNFELRQKGASFLLGLKYKI